MKHKLTTAAGTAIAAIAIAALSACGPVASVPVHSGTAPAATFTAAADPCPSGMAPDANGVCQPGGKTPAAPATTPAAPSLTVSQQQAVDAAQGYLQMGSGFSYNSLLQQLTSSYGNGFTKADARFAIGYLHPDWDAQAVEAARGYMALGGFSRASLIEQLTSAYGDGFTQAQAEYAANQVGL